MDRLWLRFVNYMYSRFKIFWVLLTLLILLICSYITWLSNIHSSQRSVILTSQNLAKKVDNFINQTFSDAHSFPQGGNSLECKQEILPYLHHIMINHPQISGVAVYDKNNQIVCSTLPNNQPFLVKNATAPQQMIGPVMLSLFDHPIYAIKRQVGEYHIEVILMSMMLENLLKIPSNDIHSIALYDQNKKKNIFSIKHKKESPSFLEQITQGQLPFITQPVLATTSLDTLKGYTIKVLKCPHFLFKKLWYNQILMAIDISIISLFLYFLIKRVLIKHDSLLWAIKKAIKKKEFYPVYQPLFNTKTNTYTGAEVLLRWQDSYDEIIMPDFFIEEAENSGLIVPITLQIIETAFKETQSILHANPNFHLSFNINGLHFTEATFFECFYQIIKDYSILPSQILLEITERDLLDEHNEIYFKKMQELRKKGFSLAIDDYGTGHASISYLQYFPFNYLKIDKLFIHAIGTKAITESLNDAIIDLAKKINLIIIAEGVETQEQVNYLLKNDIQLLQGWYFAKALSIEQLKNLLQGEKI